MYRYLKGKVTDIEPGNIVLEVNNVGYIINCANPYRYQLESEVKIYVYQQIREDEHNLFGFASLQELNLFLQLINVKGLGCRMVLPMFLNNDCAAIIEAIEKEDVGFLTSFPKIGEKLASQIILDLRGKLTTDSYQVSSELVDALKALGYKKSNIDKVAKKIDQSLPIEKQLKEALKLL